jgi:hypothetical protein
MPMSRMRGTLFRGAGDISPVTARFGVGNVRSDVALLISRLSLAVRSRTAAWTCERYAKPVASDGLMGPREQPVEVSDQQPQQVFA